MTDGHDPRSPDGPQRLEATIRGVVQGVGFRMWVARTASRTQLTGWVRNEPDGSVRCLAEGPRQDLDELLGRLHAGPSGALVERVLATFGPATGEFDGFRIRAGGHRGD